MNDAHTPLRNAKTGIVFRVTNSYFLYRSILDRMFIKEYLELKHKAMPEEFKRNSLQSNRLGKRPDYINPLTILCIYIGVE